MPCSEFPHVVPQGGHGLLLHAPFEQAHRPDVVRPGALQHPAADETYLGTSAAHIHVQVIVPPVEHLLNMVVIYQTGLLFSADYFYLYSRLAAYLPDKLRPVGRIADSRGSARPVAFHAVYLHQLPVRLHQAQQPLSLLLGDCPDRKGILSEPQRHPEKLFLYERGCPLLHIHTFYKQPDGIGPDVYRRIIRLFHIIPISKSSSPLPHPGRRRRARLPRRAACSACSR